MSSKKNKGLGKGLSALFGEQKSVEKSTKIEANSQNALIGDLARNKYQPRTIFDDEKLDELASSIKKESKNEISFAFSYIFIAGGGFSSEYDKLFQASSLSLCRCQRASDI